MGAISAARRAHDICLFAGKQMREYAVLPFRACRIAQQLPAILCENVYVTIPIYKTYTRANMIIYNLQNFLLYTYYFTKKPNAIIEFSYFTTANNSQQQSTTAQI